MIAARTGHDILGRPSFQNVVMKLDWNRILWEARGLHAIASSDPDHRSIENDVCGLCIRNTLLKEDE